jgi:hypothetical protein
VRAYWLLLATLAVWRVTHLATAEAGPWNVMGRFRTWAGRGMIGQLLDCFYCASLWVSAPAAWIVVSLVSGTPQRDLRELGLLWLALSAGAILLERVTSVRGGAAPAAYQEDPHG